MATYHIECFERMTGTKVTTKRFRSQREGVCAHPECTTPIKIGEYITWTRRGATAGNDGEKQAKQAGNAIFNVEALADAIAPMIEERLDLANLAAGISNVTTIEIQPIGELPKIELGIQHKKFPHLLAACNARLNTWVAGPAGSGKTTAAEMVAKALSLPFYYTGAVGDQYALLGYNDANGRYVRTPFRECYENGGVFLWDEVDGSDANALVAFNAALANGQAAFPDAMVKRHADCVIIAAANTWGHGGTHEYVGRNKLDAAFLDRFVRIEWPYDHDLERATCADKEWCERVQKIRARIQEKKLRVLVTPRASYLGARLLAAGLDRDTVESMTIAAAMTPEQWESVRAA